MKIGPLTAEEVAALFEGTLIEVFWSGGNGPHQYRVHVERGRRYAAPLDGNPRMLTYNELADVGQEPFHTRVWIAEGADLDPMAGHRTTDPHDCFQMNCKGMGPELERLRFELQMAENRRYADTDFGEGAAEDNDLPAGPEPEGSTPSSAVTPMAGAAALDTQPRAHPRPESA